MADLMEYKCPACGGTMEFESTPGQGTRVRVHLKGGGQT